ncbi:MAG: hypothetical protein IKY22_09315 [Bacteroidales bacterium]|nr:hypothetical protein [Bacteroidales bacterium]
MTKYFKLLGVALIATSLAFVSCGEDPVDPVDPGTGTNPPTEEVTPGVKVTFGTATWEAAAIDAYNMSSYGAITLDAYSEPTGEEFPFVMFGIYATAQGTYTDNVTEELGYANEKIAYLEYWEAKYWALGQYQYGDWWTKEATINITEVDLTALTLSMNINATMFLFEDIVVMKEDGTGYSIDPTLLSGATTENMTVVATKVAMQSSKGGLKK